MKKHVSVMACALVILLSMVPVRGEYVTLTARVVDNTVFPSDIITLATNEFAQVLHTKLESANGSDTGTEYMFIAVSVGGQTFNYKASSISNQSIGLPAIAGPATIRLTGSPVVASVKAACTVKVTRANELFVPSNAVVIPADTNGPVTIILESSIDLISWTPASPGTYGTSTSMRFFRVRAQR